MKSEEELYRPNSWFRVHKPRIVPTLCFIIGVVLGVALVKENYDQELRPFMQDVKTLMEFGKKFQVRIDCQELCKTGYEKGLLTAEEGMTCYSDCSTDSLKAAEDVFSILTRRFAARDWGSLPPPLGSNVPELLRRPIDRSEELDPGAFQYEYEPPTTELGHISECDKQCLDQFRSGKIRKEDLEICYSECVPPTWPLSSSANDGSLRW